MEQQSPRKTYTKPELKKHETLKQITFSRHGTSNRSSYPKHPPLDLDQRLGSRAEWTGNNAGLTGGAAGKEVTKHTRDWPPPAGNPLHHPEITSPTESPSEN